MPTKKEKPPKATKQRRASKRSSTRPHTLTIGYSTKSGRWSSSSPAGRLIAAAWKGAPQKDACAFAGISTRTFQLWRTAWSDLDPTADDHTGTDALLLRFFRLYDDAAASLMVDIVGSWAETAKTDWRAAQAFLARRDPEAWGDPAKRVELTGAEGEPVAVSSPVASIVAAAIARATAEAE